MSGWRSAWMGKQTRCHRPSRGFKGADQEPEYGPPFPRGNRLPNGLPGPVCAGFHQSTSKSMAAIPSSGSLVATHDYYRRE